MRSFACGNHPVCAKAADPTSKISSGTATRDTGLLRSGLFALTEREPLSHLALQMVDVGGRLLVAVARGAEGVAPLAVAEPGEAAAGPEHVVDSNIVVDRPIQDHRPVVEV